MSWAVGYDTRWCRDIGYGVPATCDQPRCPIEVDRGLGYVCGGEPYGGEHGCGLFFCGEHRDGYTSGDDERFECPHSFKDDPGYRPSPDTAGWIRHKLTDPSWQPWRQENPDEVARLAAGDSGALPLTRSHAVWFNNDMNTYAGAASDERRLDRGEGGA